MNKGKRIAKTTICMLLICALSMLSGCQLAREEEAAESKDQFMGVSVHLLTDFEFNRSPDGEYVDRSIPHEPDGEPLCLEISRGEDGEAIRSMNTGKWFSDLKTYFNTVDTDEERSETVGLEAVMYICPEEFEGTPYLTLEHVYRREDGTLYAVDCGSNYGGHLDGLSLSIKESNTFSDSAGNRRENTVEVKLNVKERSKVEQVRLYAMRGSQSVGELILGSEEEVWLVPGTEWALMEETLSDGSILRTAFNQPLDGTHITLFTVCEDGIFIPQHITLRMAGAE